jgi:hypothetical protein
MAQVRSIHVPVSLAGGLARFDLATALMLALLGVGCSDVRCPSGFTDVAGACKKDDPDATRAIDNSTAGENEAGSREGSDAAITDANYGRDSDAQVPVSADSAAIANEAAVATAVDASTRGCSADGSCSPPLDCDPSRACSAGYVCTAGKCVSACEQHRCDTNATCSLVAAAPSCSCNTGFISVPATAATPARCAADLACAELGCHVNSECELGSDMLRRCVCKPGHTGNGTSCTPISCDPLRSPENGSVAHTGGRTFEQWGEYSCSAGFALSGGTARRQCQSNGMWSGTAPTCVLACQATNDCRPGAACLESADCGNGNTCEGNACLIGSCPGGSVSNIANYAEKRYCKEINGDLVIPMDANSLAQIDFPHLTRVLGRIEFSRETEFIAKRSVTFGALTHVAGLVRMIVDSPGDTELRFPRLERVDGGIALTQIDSVKVFDMSALTTAGSLSLQYLYGQMDLRIGALRTVTGTIAVMWVPWIGYRPIFARLADPAQVSVGQGRLIIQVGCSVTGNSSADCPTSP